MQQISTVVERLGNMSGQKLVDWTSVSYNPVLSYTGASLANRFHLQVDGSTAKEDGGKGLDRLFSLNDIIFM